MDTYSYSNVQSTQRTRQATILNSPSTCVYQTTRRPTTRRRTQTEIADAAQIGKRVILNYTRWTIPTYTGYRSDPTLLQRSDHPPGGHQKRICESATLYGENNVMCIKHFYSTRKSCHIFLLRFWSPLLIIISLYHVTKFINILLIRVLQNVKDPYQASPMCLNHIITLKGGVFLVWNRIIGTPSKPGFTRGCRGNKTFTTGLFLSPVMMWHTHIWGRPHTPPPCCAMSG